MRIVERPYREADRRALLEAGMHPVLARIYAGRRIRTGAELKYEASALLPPALLGNVEQASRLLADMIGSGRRMLRRCM